MGWLACVGCAAALAAWGLSVGAMIAWTAGVGTLVAGHLLANIGVISSCTGCIVELVG